MNFAKHILSILKENKTAVLMIVVENLGSSSGKRGFKMILDSDGKLFGTIGGGIAEYKIVLEAKKMLVKNNTEIKLIRQVHNNDSENDKSGMICSGEHSVALIPVNNDKFALFETILKSIENNEKSILKISQEGIFNEKLNQGFLPKLKKENPEKWEYSEVVGNRNSIYILGAGHVGLALSKTMTDLDFHVEIFDNREDLNTFEQNEFADKKHIVDYNEIDKFIPEGENIFVTVMTFSHKSDMLVCEKLLNKNCKYFGMLASKNKVKTIKENLSEKGFSKDKLNKIYSPIGLDIKSETPAEIAISIAAQIIEIKNRR